MRRNHPSRNDGGMDRRDLIKKGVAAGAVAWTAPMVTPGTALATIGGGGVATAKCAGNTLVCFRWTRTSSSPNSCNTFRMIDMTLFRATDSCPCTPPFPQKNEPGCVDFVGKSFTFQHENGTLRTSTVLGTDGGFTVSDVFPGTWTATTTFRAVTSCFDRDGDRVWYDCYYTMRFAIASGTTACNTTFPVTKTCTILPTPADPCGFTSPMTDVCAI